MALAVPPPGDLLIPQILNQEFLRKASIIDANRAKDYELYEKYYDGIHGTQLTDRAKAYLEVNGVEYNENFCETVVDTMADRLGVAGVSSPAYDKTTQQDALAEWLWDYVWDKNRMDAGQSILHTEALKKGDAFLVVDFDNAKGCPRLAVNRPELFTHIEWDDEGVMLWAAKRWDSTQISKLSNPKAGNVVRLNIYHPNRVEKYFRLASNDAAEWSIWSDDGDDGWPIPWTEDGSADGIPLGLPVFHFANKPGTRRWGRSEIKSVLPQQNRLNKEAIDLSIVLDSLGAPQRWAKGVPNAGDLKTAAGEVWTTENPLAEFGQFDAADPAGPLAAIEATLLRLAARSRTPAHLIVLTPSGAPSGEALKTAESGIVSKSKDRSRTWGDVYADAFLLATKLANVFGEGDNKPPLQGVDLEELAYNVSWIDPETRNEKEHLESLKLENELGVSKRTVLSKIPGIDPEQELEIGMEEAAEAAEQAMGFMEAGGGLGVRPPGGKVPRSTEEDGDVEIEYDEKDRPVKVKRKKKALVE